MDFKSLAVAITTVGTVLSSHAAVGTTSAVAITPNAQAAFRSSSMADSTARLVVVTRGLPRGVAAPVTLMGPEGFRRSVRVSGRQNLKELPTGRVRLRVHPTAVGGNTWKPTRHLVSLRLQEGSLHTAKIRFTSPERTKGETRPSIPSVTPSPTRPSVVATPPPLSDQRDVTAPAAPTALAVVRTTLDGVDLEWRNPAAEDLTEVLVRRAVGMTAPTSADDGEAVAQPHPLATAVRDHGLSPGTTYSYAVFARDNAGNTSRPVLISATTRSDTSPPKPIRNLSAEATGPRTVALAWLNPDDPDVADIVVRRTGGARIASSIRDGQGIATAAPAPQTAVDTSVSDGADYTYTIFVTDQAGNVSPGTSVRLSTPLDVEPPGPVTSLREARLGPYAVTLAWSNPAVDDLAGAVVRRAEGVQPPATISDGQPVGLRSPDATTVEDDSLRPMTTYSYSVFAKDHRGNISEASTWVVTTPGDTTPPGQVAIRIPSNGELAAFDLTFDIRPPSDPDLAELIVRRSEGHTPPATVGSGTPVTLDSAVPTRVVDRGLSPSTTYSYTVFARDSWGNTNAGRSIALTTRADTIPPASPSRLEVTSTSDSTVQLAWELPTDPDVASVIVRRRAGLQAPATVTAGESVGVTGPLATSVSDTGLAAASSYSYSVFAKDARGNISQPATLTVATAPDTTAPAPVTGLVVTTTSTGSIALAWTNPSDADFSEVIVRRTDGSQPAPWPTDGRSVILSSAKATTVTDKAVIEDRQYTYAAFTRDAKGNTSSAAVHVTARTRPILGPSKDLRRADLRGQQLTNLDLSGSDLSGVDMSNTTFTNVNLTGANLADANVHGTKFAGSTTLLAVRSGGLRGRPAVVPAGWVVGDGHLIGRGVSAPGVNLSEMDLSDLDARQADLSGANLSGAELTDGPDSDPSGPLLQDINLEGANLSGTNIATASFTRANLRNVNLSDAIIRNSDFSGGIRSGGVLGQPQLLVGARLYNGYLIASGADLSSADLRGFDFAGSVIGGHIKLVGANVDGVDFSRGVDVRSGLTCDCRGASMVGVNFSGPGLSGDFSGANLAGANFEASSLGGTFTGANLAGANLERSSLWAGGTFTGANVEGTRFRGARLNSQGFGVGVFSGGITGTPADNILPSYYKWGLTNREAVPERERPWRLVNGYLVGPQAELAGADLANTDLTGISIARSNLEGTNFAGANMSYTDLINANARGASFNGALMDNARVNETTMTGATFQGADLREADFFHLERDVNLSGAILPEAQILRDLQIIDRHGSPQPVMCPVEYTSSGYVDWNWLIENGYVKKSGYYPDLDAYISYSYNSPADGELVRGELGNEGRQWSVDMVTTTKGPTGDYDQVTRTPLRMIAVRVYCNKYYPSIFINRIRPDCPWQNCSLHPHQGFASSTSNIAWGAQTVYIGGRAFRYR